MPRIDPLKLLICLSQLLAPNGGIRGSNDVKRLTGLMGKFCKKLVSKCIYIQILKCTETDLLGEFMSAGGWTLAYTWLSDGNQSKNWPLVQEILELMLLCPVDVQRLKINAAPKLVKQLSKEGGVEAVRILASKLVEQWLKIVKGETSTEMAVVGSAQSDSVAVPAASTASDATVAVHTVDMMIDSNNQQHTTNPFPSIPHPPNSDQQLHHNDGQTDDALVDVDPHALIDECTDAAAAADAAKAAMAMDDHLNGSVELHEVPDEEDDEEEEEDEDDCDGDIMKAANDGKPSAGLVFKITMKDGIQVLAKVDGGSPKKIVLNAPVSALATVAKAATAANSSDISMSRGGVGIDDKQMSSTKSTDERQRDKSKSSVSGSSSSTASGKDRSKSSSSSSSKRPSSSSSSSHHRSSSSSNSNHKISSSSSRSDKDRHRSSSSKSSSTSSSHRDKSRDKTTSQLAASQAEKDKETLNKVLATNGPLTKLGKIPKKSRDQPPAIVGADDGGKPSAAPVVKRPASISIETRNKDIENRPKTVKLFNSKFRSHGLAEEAPPPPSRRGIKKPAPSAPGTVIPSASGGVLGGTAKRRSTSPTAHDLDKRARLDLAVAANHVDKPGSIKMISPKPKPSVLMESDMFMDALFAATTSKKDASRKRKRRTSISGKETSSSTTTAAPSTVSDATPPKVEKKGGNSSSSSAIDTDTSATSSSETNANSSATSSATASAVEASAIADETAAAVHKEPEQAVPVVQQPVAPVMKFYQDTLESRRSVTPEPEADADDTAADDDATTGGDDANDADDAAAADEKNKTTDDPSETAVADASTAAATAAVDPLIPDTPQSPSADDDSSSATAPAVKGPGPGCGPDGPPGVLIIHRRRGPKKKLTWRPAGELEEVRYFELDETERCNVTKTAASFGDMKQNERTAERDGFAIARKLSGTDTMTEQMAWSFLFEVEDVPVHLNGAQSTERAVQQQRELGCLKALYFNRLMVPDSAGEPEPEAINVPHVEPLVIPLDDVTGNLDGITDFTGTPWPESKGCSPAVVPLPSSSFAGKPHSMMMHGPPDGSVQQQMPQQQQQVHQQQPPPQMPMALQMPPQMLQQQQQAAPFGGGPMNGPYGGGANGFAGPGPSMNGWNTGGGPVGPVGMMDGPPPGFMGNGPPPGMMGGPPPPQQQQQMGGPFGPGGNFGGGGNGPPFNNSMGGGGFNGNDRNGPRWIRHNNNNNWRGGHMNGGGGAPRPPWPSNARTRLCKSFAKGFCRNGDACNFLHPGHNGPMF